MSEEEKVLPVYKSEEWIEFEEQRKDFSNRDIQMEMLYTLDKIMSNEYNLIRTTEKVRANTNTMIWWLIAIPMVIGVIAAIALS